VGQVLSAYPQYNARQLSAKDRRLLSISWPGFVAEILLGVADRDRLTPGRREAAFGLMWDRIAHHFAPFWLWCSTCQAGLRPHIILKLETVSRDGPALIQLLNLTAAAGDSGSGPHPLPQVHVATPEENPDDVNVHSRAKVAEYYSQLTKAQVRELYDMYRLDHELFGYSPDHYIALAKD
jgi:hypothetical protein